MKLEWKKQEKEIYGVKTKPCVIDIPAQKYIILSGNGNPNDEIFSDKVAALFSIAYKIKLAYKALAEKNNEITDYTVYPLEGIWSIASEKEYLVKEELNVEFWKKHQSTSLEDAKNMFQQSHNEVMKLAETFSNQELFSKGIYKWIGGSTLGSYFVSVTASHYDWAMKKLKAHRKNCTNM